MYWQQPPPPPPPKEENAGLIAIVVAIGVALLLFVGAVLGAVLYLRAKSSTSASSISIATPSPATTSTTPGATWSDPDSPIPVSSLDPMKGDREALVTIVQFSDFQCPFCQRLESTLSTVMSTYRPNEVRIVWKNMPLAFHVQARPAADSGEGVFEIGGNTAFWQFHDRVYANQSTMNATNFDIWASDTGTDMTKFRPALARGDFRAKVDEDIKLATSIGVSGTPDCFVNGVELSGAQPFPKFQSTIDTELGKARAKAATGVALDRIYVTMSKENFAAKVIPSTGLSPGLIKTDTTIGSGPMAIKGDSVTVHYRGTLDDGSEFDSSIKRGTPFTFTLGSGAVIKGWDEGVAGMRVGGKRKLVIPPELAYGTRGMPPTIPANARLTFEVELLSIK